MLKWNAVGDHVYITKRAISEFLSMLAASTASQLEKSGYEYKSATPTVGNPPNQGTTICVETTVGRGIVVFGFDSLP